MSHLLSSIVCPKNHKTALVCISSNCTFPPFQCQHADCGCGSFHFKCQVMQVGAVSDYLQNWKSYVSEEGKEFMSRVQKIFSNIRSRLEKQQKIFGAYCADLFMGKDYSKLIHFIEKNEQKHINSHMIAQSIKRVTEKHNSPKFSTFTLSQMQQLDQLTNQLLAKVETLYTSKQIQMKQVECERIKRCSSAVLQRQAKNSKPSQSTMFTQKLDQSIFNLKLDLTFPRNINSKIVSEATALNRLLSKKIQKASENGFGVSEFYHKIGVVGRQLREAQLKHKKTTNLASLIMVKTEFGKVLGGYTPVQWQHSKRKDDSEQEDNPEKQDSHRSNHKLKSDLTASTVLFSLDLMEKYSLGKPDQAIYCGSKSIGFGKGDLKIADKGDQVRKSYCKFPGSYNYLARPYLGWSKSGMQLSGARYSIYFKVLQWQAFIVEY